jgi:hypothetical protein
LASTLCKDRKTLVLRCLAVLFWEAPTTNYTTTNNLNQYPTIADASAIYADNGNLATCKGWTYYFELILPAIAT